MNLNQGILRIRYYNNHDQTLKSLSLQKIDIIT